MNKKHTRETIRGTAAPVYRLALLPALVMAALGCVNTAWAVDGGVIAAGAGSIKTQGNKTTISQSSDKMVVNWKNFNIGSDQTVVVNQPDIRSAVLNRVTTASPTQIDGVLKANGRVFVVNPAGVVFGSGAKVDVGSLVATTLSADSDEFMSGGRLSGGKYPTLQLKASGGEGQIVNKGKLTAQELVLLIGPQVVNSGVVHGKDVTMAGVSDVTLSMVDSRVGFTLGKQTQDALVANYGSIAASKGNVWLMTAANGAAIGSMVQNTGRIDATAASELDGGAIILTSKNGGKISVGGQLTTENDITVNSEGWGGPSAHDVTIESGAKLQSQRAASIHSDGGHIQMNGIINAANSVRIDSTVLTSGDMGPEAPVGMITTSGKINARTVNLTSSAVNINAPIKAEDAVYVESQFGDLNQRADITSTNGNVNLLSGGSIIQADGVKTSAAGTVALDNAWRHLVDSLPADQIRAANISAKTISIKGNDVMLAGNLKADGDISVQSKSYNPPCPADSSCIAAMKGGHISQTGNVISSNGSVLLDATTSIVQQPNSRISADKIVTLKSGDVETGKIDAGTQINVNAYRASLGGKLTAPEINVPANTLNQGKIHILPKSANL
jgi:filamentous hemagglutinin family protein